MSLLTLQLLFLKVGTLIVCIMTAVNCFVNLDKNIHYYARSTPTQ